jgi:hypothetical protein
LYSVHLFDRKTTSTRFKPSHEEGNMADKRYDLETVKKMSAQDALAELKRQGITSLDDLVKKGIEDLRAVSADAKEEGSFIFRCFIYRCSSEK